MYRFADRKKSPTEQRKQLFTTLLKSKPQYKPGSKFVYSNLGFMLAGLMLETTTNTSWRDLMRRYLFQPLKMESAGFGPPATKKNPDHPWGHSKAQDKLTHNNVDNPPILGPAGRVHCTIADWSRFALLHMGHVSQDDDSESDKPLLPLDRDTLKFLHRPLLNTSYTFGWGIAKREWAGGTALSHSGSNTVWYSTIWIAPAKDRAFLAATNVGRMSGSQACDHAIVQMIDLTKPKE